MFNWSETFQTLYDNSLGSFELSCSYMFCWPWPTFRRVKMKWKGCFRFFLCVFFPPPCECELTKSCYEFRLHCVGEGDLYIVMKCMHVLVLPCPGQVLRLCGASVSPWYWNLLIFFAVERKCVDRRSWPKWPPFPAARKPKNFLRLLRMIDIALLLLLVASQVFARFQVCWHQSTDFMFAPFSPPRTF